jgi:hypothetical protein
MTDMTTAPPPVDSSVYAQELVQAGYAPTVVSNEDYLAMQAQLAALANKVRLLEIERGVPIDQVDGYRKQLIAHAQVRNNSRPDVDFTQIFQILNALPQDPTAITSAQTDLVSSMLTSLVNAHPGKELDYLTVLAMELHQAVLTRDGSVPPMTARVTQLEALVNSLYARLNTPTASVPAPVPTPVPVVPAPVPTPVPVPVPVPPAPAPAPIPVPVGLAANPQFLAAFPQGQIPAVPTTAPVAAGVSPELAANPAFIAAFPQVPPTA